MLIVNREQTAIIRTPHGSEIRPLIDRTNSPVNECSLAEELLPPGRRVTPHHHQVMEEIYYILEGAGLMEIGDEKREVSAGEAIYIPRGARHSLTNTGTDEMRILLVCGPAYLPSDHRSEQEGEASSDE